MPSPLPLPLPSFPFLSPTEFHAACVSVEKRYQRQRQCQRRREAEHTDIRGWRDARVYERDGETALVVRKDVDVDTNVRKMKKEGDSVTATKRDVEVEVEDEEIEDDDDPESLVRHPNPEASEKLEVEYNILLSPTYQVPVLYFSLIDRSAGVPAPAAGDLDVVYDQLVPAQFKSGLRGVGVLGGISVGNHPVSGIPTYFVHPCNTADALRDVADPKSMPNTNTYLLLWLGLVGGCVNLQVPRALVAEAEAETGVECR